MSPDPSQYLPVDASDEPSAPAGFAWPADATVLFTLARTSPSVTPLTYKLTLDELRQLVLPPLVAPVVAFTSPLTGTNAVIGQPLLLQVTATAPGGVAQVAFYVNGALLGLGQANGNTYTAAYTPEPGSTLNLMAQATGTNGAVATSSVFLFLHEAVAVLPTVTLTTPLTGSTAFISQPLLLRATASSPVGVDYVEFFSGTTSLGHGDPAGNTYSLVYTPGPGSTLNLSARAVDHNGGVATDNAFVFLSIAPVSLPTISGFTPSSGVVGTRVRVTGLHLGAASAVTVNGVAATSFTVLSDTSVLLSVPDYGGGDGRIAVTTPLGTAQSDASFLTTAPVAAPGAPTLSAIAGNGSVTLTIGAPASNGGAPITGYQLFRRGTNAPLAIVSGGSYTDSTAANGTAYAYNACAVNSVGAGPLCDFTLAVTPTAPPAPVLSMAYHGATTTSTPSVSDILALPAELFGTGTQTLSFNCAGTYPTFAELASNGNRPVILDKNGFDVSGDIIKAAQIINGRSYNVYTHGNPQYDAAFILKFI